MPGSPETTLEHDLNQPAIPASADDVRLANKVNKLVDEKLITPEQASEATGSEIDRMVDELFMPRFSQNYYRPEHIEPLKPGQKAEHVVINLLKELPGMRVEHTTDADDHGLKKADLVLWFDGDPTPVYVQLTAQSNDQKVRAKLEKSPLDTIVVELPGNIFRELTGMDKAGADIGRRVRHEVMVQVIKGLQFRPTYQHTLGTLQARMSRR